MSEKISPPQNPSEEFAKVSSRSREHSGKYDVLAAESAAYAAKPYMDVAVELHHAGDGDYAENGPLSRLVDYAERRAHQAVRGERDDSLTPLEKELLGVYKADAKLTVAETAIDYPPSAQQLDLAFSTADKKMRKAAVGSEEYKKWRDVKARTQDFEQLYHGGLSEADKAELGLVALPESTNAGFLLNMLGADGKTVNPDILREYEPKAIQDGKNMQVTTSVFELLAELEAQSPTQPEVPPPIPSSEAAEMLKRQEYLHAAGEVKGYQDKVDPEILDNAWFSDTSKFLQTARGRARNEGNTSEETRLGNLIRAMNEYDTAFYNDSQDVLTNKVDPDSMEELKRRRDFMELLATVHPKEYDPDNTILPDDHIKRHTVVREYFADPKHPERMNTSNPESIKLMRDYLVLQARKELDGVQPGFRAGGDIVTLAFRMTPPTMKQLRENSREQMFAWQLVADKLGKPKMTFGEFKAMPFTKITEALGIDDVRKHIPDYDQKVFFKQKPPREIPEAVSFS